MRVSDLTKRQLAAMIDHTVLKAQAQESHILRLCEEAREHGFGTVCLAPVWVQLARRELAEAHVGIASVIGFPHGNTLSSVKAYEAEQAMQLGATEFDMVINIGALKDRNEKTVGSDIEAVVEVARRNSCIVKVIIEAALLSSDEKQLACQLARKAGADFVKTSTGFAGEGKGATVEDVKSMKEWVDGKLGVKAAGGIRDCETAISMVEAGASRLGCSSSVEILRQFESQYNDRSESG